MPSTPYKGFALIDCNNFFVSCERVFKPHLNSHPVAVLSNNDGCIIARSNEVKALGIPMGAPVFKYRELLKRHDVVTFSSNFKLYGDLSDRVMQIIADFSPDLEIYSIDEAFVPLSFETLKDFLSLRERILKWTGIPVSVGLGPTKTLAKLANALSKKMEKPGFSLLDFSNKKHLLKELPIRDVWGIGKQHAHTLKAHSILTAYDFCYASEEWVRRKMKLPGLRTQLELKGIPCYLPEVEDPKRKSLVYSKSFGRAITTKGELSHAATHYAAKAALKIRRKGYVAQNIALYLKQKDQSWIKTSRLSYPTDSSRIYIEVVHRLLNQMFKEGSYLKVGIHLSDLSRKENQQFDLIDTPDPKHDRLMTTLDQVNEKYGSHTLFFAGEGLSKPWRSLGQNKTRDYTSSWDELLTIEMDAQTKPFKQTKDL